MPARALALVLLVAAVLVFPGLGATRLWQDEGQTAVVARNVLATGLPLASDGTNTVSLFADRRDIRDGIYIWQPWVPSYVAAASMFVFGQDSFGARFPFALCFVLLVALCHRFYGRWQSDRMVVWITTLLTAGSVTLLLHARQCRYYLLGALLGVLVVDAYLRVQRGDGRGGVVRLVFWSTLLFNVFPPGAILLAAAIGIDALWSRKHWRGLILAAGVITVVNLPGAVFMRIWDRQFGVQPGYSEFRIFGLYLTRYVLSLNLFLFPLIAVVAAAIVRRRNILKGTWIRDPLTRLILLVTALQVVGFALVSDYPFTRYLIGVAPFVLYLGARCLVVLSAGRVWAAGLLLLATLTSNVLALPPLLLVRGMAIGRTAWSTAGIDGTLLTQGDVGGSFARGEIGLLARTPLGSPLWDYLTELREAPTGPIDRLVEHLEQHGTAGDRVYVGYGDLALMFHSSLEIQAASDPHVRAPEFFVQRNFNPIHPRRLAAQGVLRSNYDSIALGVPDFQWNNSPDPLYHRFRDDAADGVPELLVFRRRD